MTATPLQFFHGSQVVEGTQAIQSPVLGDQAAVGLVGTADNADNVKFPFNEPILIQNPSAAAGLGTAGTLPQAIADIYAQSGCNVVLVRVPSSADLDTQLASVIGSQSAQTGVHALLSAAAMLGVKPKTLIAPGFTSQRVASVSAPGVVGANPVVGALLPIAESLRGRVYASTPSTNFNDAFYWAADWGSDRVVAFYPNVLTWAEALAAYVTVPADATMAGLLAKVQNTKGFWWSPSNQLIDVGGTSSPITFDNSYSCLANLLNENKIATIINIQKSMGNGIGGWRRWGNTNLSANTATQFECVRTTMDAIYDALDTVSLQWVDADPTPQTLADMTFAAQKFFDSMKNQGVIIGGKVWMDANDNNAQQMSQGIYCWRIDPTPAAPMQTITYYAQLNNNYYTAELDALASIINAGTLNAGA
jgi:uncharacterized protein